MRVLITPNYAAAYDCRMVHGLAEGFVRLGHQAFASDVPLDAYELASLCVAQGAQVVIQVNRTRDREHPLPAGVRHIAWYQDVFPQTLDGFAERFDDGDILYALGDASVLGMDLHMPCYVGSLVSGVDPWVFEYRNGHIDAPVDFSLCGFIPPPLSRRKSLLSSLLINGHSRVGGDVFAGTVERNYAPLRGNLDIHALADDIRTAVNARRGLASLRLRAQDRIARALGTLSPLDRAISYFTREYPRQLDRLRLTDAVLSISDSLELYGPGWERHPHLRRYARGMIEEHRQLLDVYLRTRINLANNTHGLGLHSRTLECMAVKGFVFTHASPHDGKPGGMLTSFEPDKHYGSYTAETVEQEARRWLANPAARTKAGEAASAVVRQKHCWHHRAAQIIDDLNR